MSFSEKLQIVLFSGLVGIICSLITNYLIYNFQVRRKLLDLPGRLDLFAKDLQASIVNNDADAVKPHRDQLLGSYGVISLCIDMKSCFEEMNSMYYFLSDGGYVTCTERKTLDLERLYFIQQKIGDLKPKRISIPLFMRT